MPFIAYKITHRESGKAYIGITTRSLRERWMKHRSTKKHAIGDALRKYGVDAFEIEHIASATTLDDLRELERALVEQHNTLSPFGYNLCAGGIGVLSPSAESIEKRRVANTGKKWTEEQKARHAITLTGRKMPPRTAEHAAKLSASLKGYKFPPLTVEARAKISAAHLGRKRPLETGEKIAAAKRGKPRTEAAKAAMRAGWAARKASMSLNMQPAQMDLF